MRHPLQGEERFEHHLHEQHAEGEAGHQRDEPYAPEALWRGPLRVPTQSLRVLLFLIVCHVN